MSINLDEIVAGSNSVDDLISAISGASAENAKASNQILQLVEATKGTLSPIQQLKDLITAPSAAGKLRDQKEYMDYQVQEQENGNRPKSWEDWSKEREQSKQKNPNSNTEQG